VGDRDAPTLQYFSVLSLIASSTKRLSSLSPDSSYLMWIEVQGFGKPYFGRSPESKTLRDVSFCFLFLRIATMSIPVHAPRAVRTALIGPMPFISPSFES